MIENLDDAGGAWGPKKAYALDLLIGVKTRAEDGYGAAQLARDAGVSTDFISSLRGYDVRYRDGAKYYTSRDQSKVVRVAGVLGLSEDELMDKIRTGNKR